MSHAPSRPTASTPRSSSVHSVERAVQVLRALADTPGGGSALALSAATGLDRTTVHRLLRTLAGAGMVAADGANYVLGPACTLLGAGRLDSTRLRELALPYAVDLQRSSVQDRPLVVSISCRALDQVVIVDRIWTPAVPLDIIVGIGWRFPIDGPVSGRTMLATLPGAAITALIGRKRHAAIAPTLVSIRARDGMEFGSDEKHPGVSAMASPLVGADGMAVGALVVAGLGLVPDLSPDSRIARNLQRCAQSISRRLQSGR
jgi:IclR family acetate operon transcriptional repressor